MQKNSLPVGVFDSGLGGLTAVREIKRILPEEHIIYFGDTGRLPYGTRSPEIIKKYACDDMNFLLTNSVKAVLVACGTVSSTALELLKNTFKVPVIGVVEPAAKCACSLTVSGRIAVLATPSTIRTGAFEKTIKEINPEFEVVGVGCPMFVPLVENGYIDKDNPVALNIAKEYISKLAEFKPDVIILGCTHYPIIKETVKKCANELIGNVEIVDSGSCAAAALKEYLEKTELANRSQRNTNCGKTEYYVSDCPHNFSEIASLFLGEKVDKVTQIDIENYLYQPQK